MIFHEIAYCTGAQKITSFLINQFLINFQQPNLGVLKQETTGSRQM